MKFTKKSVHLDFISPLNSGLKLIAFSFGLFLFEIVSGGTLKTSNVALIVSLGTSCLLRQTVRRISFT